MGKSESKYFNTAKRMDKALLKLLEYKDFDYITIKEICEKAQVNRSTFYLHYETINDLLEETIRYMSSEFIEYFNSDKQSFRMKIHDANQEELYLITPEYLTPYLQYIKDHKKIYMTAITQTMVLGSNNSMDVIFNEMINPIMDSYHIEEKKRKYILSFYIEGIIAIVKIWIKNNCEEAIPFIVETIEQCVQKPNINKSHQ